MAHIILTIPGPWSNPPAVEADFDLEFLGPQPSLVEDIEVIASRSGALEAAEIQRVRRHMGVVVACVPVGQPGDPQAARAAARFALTMFKMGGQALLIETSVKVLSPSALTLRDLEDIATLFHLFVEVLVAPETVSTEGMVAFGLPDVVVSFTGKTHADAAQAAAFTCAARMVCDGFEPVTGTRFRASLSAPAFELSRRLPPSAAASEADPFDNPLGQWLMSPEPPSAE